MKNKYLLGDCLELMKDIADESVDLILCDLPYGTTQCKWDAIIPFNLLWKQYERIISPNGAILLTANHPFTAVLVASNLALFRYEWIWEKEKATRFLDCKKRPLQAHESVLVFYKRQPVYNPQMGQGLPYNKGYRRGNEDKSHGEIYGNFKGAQLINETGLRYPRTVLKFNSAKGDGKYHPTQKPIDLFKYFILTYTNKGMVVMDNCVGSGTTAIACLNTGRKFICMEKDPNYYAIGRQRVVDHIAKIKAT